MSNRRGKIMQILTGNVEKFAFKLGWTRFNVLFKTHTLVFYRVDSCSSDKIHLDLLFW